MLILRGGLLQAATVGAGRETVAFALDSGQLGFVVGKSLGQLVGF